MKKLLLLASLCAASIGASHPISMDYEVQTIGINQYRYTFYLRCDTNDPQFVPGGGWAWHIFGDRFLGQSPLDDYVGDPNDLPVGPWTNYSYSSGGHNGPTFHYVLDPWRPAVSETLTWRCTASRDLAQGFLLYSFLIPFDGAPFVDFFVANRLNPGGRQYCLGNVSLMNYIPDQHGVPAEFEIRDIDTSNPVFSMNQALTYFGSWLFEIDPALPPGDYYLAVKATHFLRQTQIVTIEEGGVQRLQFSLINGDADPDNEVNLVDAAAVSAAFGSTEGDPNWNPMADLDGDGEVNLVDHSIISANFGLAGDE